MITHAHHLAERPPIFAAPFGAILAGLISDIPRYEREKSAVSFARNGSSEFVPPPSAAAIALQSRIVDVLKASALVMAELPDRKVLDATSIALAIGSKRSTVYKALYLMLDEGRVGKVVHSRLCVEWVKP